MGDNGYITDSHTVTLIEQHSSTRVLPQKPQLSIKSIAKRLSQKRKYVINKNTRSERAYCLTLLSSEGDFRLGVLLGVRLVV